MRKPRNRIGGFTKKHDLSHAQHQLWVKEKLASHPKYPQYRGHPDRDRGSSVGHCHCEYCGWRGKYDELIAPAAHGASFRRPSGYCPQCGQRPFWAMLTEAQALVLKP